MDKYVILFSNGSKLIIEADIMIDDNDDISFYNKRKSIIENDKYLVARFFKNNIAGFSKYESAYITNKEDL